MSIDQKNTNVYTFALAFCSQLVYSLDMDMRDKVIQREKSKVGLRGRINAFCAHCIYDPIAGNGTWREQIEKCTSYDCPLYEVRPHKRGGKAQISDQLDENSEISIQDMG